MKTADTLKLAHKRILVVGLGISGLETARFLHRMGADVLISDRASAAKLASYVAQLNGTGIRLELGGHQLKNFESADLIIISPGVPHTIGPLEAARKLGIPVWGEVELASRFIETPIIAVSGTNGKTTTTALLGGMLARSGIDVFVGGNIGTPLTGYLNRPAKATIVVAEISSFQLDTISTFRPRLGLLLNITPDHLDRYPDFKAYAGSKLRLFENQNGNDLAILNRADKEIEHRLRQIKSRCLFFNIREPDAEGAFVSPKEIRWHLPSQDKAAPMRLALQAAELKLYGRHNLENVAAAGLAALMTGGTPAGVLAAAKEFEGLPHRLTRVSAINGVDFFDDSKATNPEAVIRALAAFSRPVVLIMGGQHKGGAWEPLADPLNTHVKRLITLGEAGPAIGEALGHFCGNGWQNVESMDAAIQLAFEAAAPGDTVLLSPGCASFDMYQNYAERGDAFCAAVKRLAGRSDE